MEMKVVTLTKEMAAEFLMTNTRNRPEKRSAVRRYADDMMNNRWLLTGEALKFDKDNHLLDGQNRCLALLLACELAQKDITIQTLVLTGIDSHTQDAMDGNVRRSVGDQLAMRGHGKQHKLAAALKIVAAYDGDAILREDLLPRMRLISLYESDSEAFDQCNHDEVDYDNSSYVNASVRVAARYILLRRVKADPDAVQEFFSKLASGVDLPAGSPILTLRIRQQRVKFNGIRQRNNLTLLLVLRSWNAWRRGSPMKKLQDRNPQGEIIIPKTIEQ